MFSVIVSEIKIRLVVYQYFELGYLCGKILIIRSGKILIIRRKFIKKILYFYRQLDCVFRKWGGGFG